jgi:hypothetical protein
VAKRMFQSMAEAEAEVTRLRRENLAQATALNHWLRAGRIGWIHSRRLPGGIRYSAAPVGLDRADGGYVMFWLRCEGQQDSVSVMGARNAEQRAESYASRCSKDLEAREIARILREALRVGSRDFVAGETVG